MSNLRADVMALRRQVGAYLEGACSLQDLYDWIAVHEAGQPEEAFDDSWYDLAAHFWALVGELRDGYRTEESLREELAGALAAAEQTAAGPAPQWHEYTLAADRTTP